MVPAKLACTKGVEKGREIIFETEEVIIGRDPAQAGVVVQDGSISRKHARFVFQDDHWAVENLGSSNGVFVNDTELTARAPLKPGDRVRLGSVPFRFLLHNPGNKTMDDYERTIQFVGSAEYTMHGGNAAYAAYFSALEQGKEESAEQEVERSKVKEVKDMLPTEEEKARDASAPVAYTDPHKAAKELRALKWKLLAAFLVVLALGAVAAPVLWRWYAAEQDFQRDAGNVQERLKRFIRDHEAKELKQQVPPHELQAEVGKLEALRTDFNQVIAEHGARANQADDTARSLHTGLERVEFLLQWRKLVLAMREQEAERASRILDEAFTTDWAKTATAQKLLPVMRDLVRYYRFHWRYPKPPTHSESYPELEEVRETLQVVQGLAAKHKEHTQDMEVWAISFGFTVRHVFNDAKTNHWIRQWESGFWADVEAYRALPPGSEARKRARAALQRDYPKMNWGRLLD